MIARNHVVEIEFLEKTVLPTDRITHHRFDPLAASSRAGNHNNSSRTKDFFNSLSQETTLALDTDTRCYCDLADVAGVRQPLTFEKVEARP